MAIKTLEDYFREQAEVIDRIFAQRFREHDERIERIFAHRFEEFGKKWDEERLDQRIEARLEPLRTDLKRLTDAVLTLVARLP